jgi:RNMT-activating mini protein
MAAVQNLSDEDIEFLEKCEEEFKDRYTEKDDHFIKVFNAEPSTPLIVERWYPQNPGRRNDRRNNRHHPYERHGNRDYNDRRDYRDRRDYHDRRDDYDRRGYSDYGRSHDRRGGGYRQHRQRY